MKKPLTLTKKDFQKNALKFFANLDKDEELQKKFINSPVEVVSDKIYKRKKKESIKASQANKLVFSILASEEFQRFLKDYDRKYGKKENNHDNFIRKFAEMIVETKDISIVTNLVTNSFNGARITDEEGAFSKQYSYSVTEVNNSGAAVYNKTYTVTENKTKGLNLDDIEDRIISASKLRHLAEQIIQRAKELEVRGELVRPRIR